MLSPGVSELKDLQQLMQQLPVAFILLESDELFVRFANELALDILNKSEKQILNKRIDEVKFPGGEWGQVARKVFETGIAIRERESPLIFTQRNKLVTKWYDRSFIPWRDKHGKTRGVLVTAADISDKVLAINKTEEHNKSLQELADALKKSEERYQNYLQHSTEGIWRIEVTNPVSIELPAARQIELFFEYAYMAECNDAMAKMYGYTKAEEIIGKPLDAFLPRNEESVAYLNYFIDCGYRLEGTESIETDKDGNTKYFSNNLVGITENGFLVRAWGTQRDISLQKLAEEKIRQSEQQQRELNEQLEKIVEERTAQLAALNNELMLQNETFHQAEESSKQGSYSFNLTSGKLFYSDNLYKLLGFEPGEFEPALEEFNNHVHPDDRDYVSNAAQKVLQTQQPDTWRYRMITKNGDVLRILGTGRVITLNNEILLVGTLQDVTELAESEELLKQKNIELQQTIDQLHLRELRDEQKDSFIAMASHELKTPITSIKGYVQLLMSEFEKKEDEEKMISPLLLKSSLISIDKQVARLTRLISELLDLTRIETGTLELKNEPFSLNELAIEMVQDILYTNPDKQIHISHDVHAHVYADKDRIGQVMTNLLNNAVKYSPNNNRIDIAISAAGNNRIAFHVRDRGIGIDKNDHERIFERFYRAKDSHAQTYPGFGIGLFIVKEFIQRHGGDVSVQSEKGVGSIFSFTLPVYHNTSH